MPTYVVDGDLLSALLVDHLASKKYQLQFSTNTKEYLRRFHCAQKPWATFHCTILFNIACGADSLLAQAPE